MNSKKALFWFGLALFALLSPISFAHNNIPTPTGYITDGINLLSQEIKDQLEVKLAEFERKTGNQIAVVITDSLEGDAIENFANKLFEQIKIGQKGLDNGVLFLVVKDDRQARIEVGYGLEDKLTDIESKIILEKSAFPLFKQNDYTLGITKTIEEITTKLSSADTSPSAKKSQQFPLQFLYILFAVVVTFFMQVLAKSKAWWQGGIAGGVVGLIMYAITSFMIIIPVFIVLGLVFDYLLSKFHKGNGRGTGGGMWFFGGGPWGSGENSQGFGGFGGGRTGGGGASGKW